MVAAPSSSRLSRRSVRSRLSVAPVARSPVLFEFTYHTARVGYVGEAKPKHWIPLTVPPSQYATAATWYRYLSPLIQQLFTALVQDPTERRLIVIFDTGLETLRLWQQALEQCAWDAGAPAVSVLPALETIPMAFPSLKDVLIVQITSQQAFCLAHAAGQSLPYTFQSVPAGYHVAVKTKEYTSTVKSEWTDQMTYTWLNHHNPESLMAAILKCLQACPRSIRKQVIHNLVFVGEACMYRPDLRLRVAKHLQSILKRTAKDDDSSTLKEQETPLTRIPKAFNELEPLAGSIGVVETAPYRADLLAWAGASVWASHVHGLDPDSARFQWTKKPESS